MILRFRSPDGSYRVDVQPGDSVTSLRTKLLEQVPKDVDPKSFILSDKPANGRTRPLRDILIQSIQSLDLKHGDLLYLTYTRGAATEKKPPAATATSIRLNGQPIKLSEDVSHKYTTTTAGLAEHNIERSSDPWESVTQDPIDEQLEKMDGKIPRTRDQKMCKHGPKGMCDYCMPMEPYDAAYLAEKKIKHLSFHAYLRKSNIATNRPELKSSYMPPLSEPNYTIRKNCPSGHAPWPDGICSKCQPSAITLQPQTFRMVDHVEFSDPSLIDTFIDFWRRSGCQRIGYLYGRYALYPEIPLGIKAVVEAIYEPPQISEPDGVTLLSPWETDAEVDAVAALCGLRKVGVIFTDLLDDTSGNGTVVCKRHIGSYYLSSLEIVFAAQLQARYPNPSKWSETGRFGSKFVTCVVSGNEDGGIDVAAYQVSNSAVEMVRADIIEPCAEPGKMLVRDEDGKSRYVPEVFFRHKNEYGVNVQENAKPAFPVEYLLVTLTHGFPTSVNPMFKAPNKFPVENREAIGVAQEHGAVARQLGIDSGKPEGGLAAVSDFHLLVFLQKWGILEKREEELLAQVATTVDVQLGHALSQSPGWQTLMAILKESV